MSVQANAANECCELNTLAEDKSVADKNLNMMNVFITEAVNCCESCKSRLI